jgi:magnesium and cobalt exporter, CNNM family
MDTSDSLFGVRFFLLVLILAVNGFFAMAEVSLLTVRGSRLRQLAEEGNKGAQAALSLLANPGRLLSVTQVGVTLASLGLGWAGEDTLFRLFTAMFAPLLDVAGAAVLHGVSFVFAFLLMSFAHVVIGEVVPKNLGLEKADRLAAAVAPPLLVFYRVSAPFVSVIEKSAALVSKALGLKGDHSGGGHSAEELKMVVSLSRGSGMLPPAQEDMIHRVIDLDTLYVREIMVPRQKIVSVPVEATLEQVLATMIREQHSRLPVYDGKPENIAGVLFSKDLLPVWAERRAAIAAGRRPPEFRVRAWMRKHLVVPETKPLLQMLEEFRQGRSHMALVVDEFGTIVGLLTVEDVLEQIVGEIEDEYDPQAPQRAADEAPPAVVELDGTTLIRDLDTQYGIELPSDAGFETLAGFLLSRFGDLPKEGAALEHDGRKFTVIEMERKRIARVRVEKLAALEEEQPAKAEAPPG